MNGRGPRPAGMSMSTHPRRPQGVASLCLVPNRREDDVLVDPAVLVRRAVRLKEEDASID
jgi:hypothetical protein